MRRFEVDNPGSCCASRSGPNRYRSGTDPNAKQHRSPGPAARLVDQLANTVAVTDAMRETPAVVGKSGDRLRLLVDSACAGTSTLLGPLTTMLDHLPTSCLTERDEWGKSTGGQRCLRPDQALLARLRTSRQSSIRRSWRWRRSTPPEPTISSQRNGLLPCDMQRPTPAAARSVGRYGRRRRGSRDLGSFAVRTPYHKMMRTPP
jgi:hypothetical protein